MNDYAKNCCRLGRKDLMVFEQRLCDCVGRLFSFSGHSLFFPRRSTALEAGKDGGKLLLPLPGDDGEALGVFVATGVKAKESDALLDRWPALASLVTENLLLYKRSLCDPTTGLFTRHYLLECLEREMESLREPFRAPSRSGAEPGADSGARTRAGDENKTFTRRSGQGLFAAGAEAPVRSCLGLLTMRLPSLKDVVREYGYRFADSLIESLARTVAKACPEHTLAARTGDAELAVLIPTASPKACRSLAESLAVKVKGATVVHSLNNNKVAVTPAIGYAMYPQDMAGGLFVRSIPEQARLLLRKSRLAAALAGDEQPIHQGREPVMAFGRILAEGGLVCEVLPLSRVVISLGSSMHAREGQRFSIWSTNYPVRSESGAGRSQTPLYKGELVIMEVWENTSMAEIIHLGDPTWNIEPGDRLALLPEEHKGVSRTRGGVANGQDRIDPETGLLCHGDFLVRWTASREACEKFSLTLVRLAPKYDENSPYSPEPENAQNSPYSSNLSDPTGFMGFEAVCHAGQFVPESVQICREELGSDILGGRYGLSSFVFFHPNAEGKSLQSRYETLARALEERLGLDVAVGIASHPCLDFRKADSLENAQKALEYAMLLPSPHVGILDSLALNISADKLFSTGDTFGSIKEYQLAILADNDNGMAWNSLGICLAGIGRSAEALRHFNEALRCNPNDAMALYNAGYVRQTIGETVQARENYEKCLENSPGHIFALLRLGQMAENENDLAGAESLYGKAAELPGGHNLTSRHFARLCLKKGDSDKAREHLHEALLRDPQDALSMQLLAGICLDAGEDPEIAAVLARQSLSLRPELKAAWLELARALETLGRTQEAKEARLKAGVV